MAHSPEPLDIFVITAGNGDMYHVHQFKDASGKDIFRTDGGLEVIRDPDVEFLGTFLIPALGVSATDNRAVDGDDE